jgi:hypothetical protein
MANQPNALAQIQAEVKAPKGQFNAFGKYKYRSAEDILESVKPVVNSKGFSISVSDTIVMVGDRYYVQSVATLTDGKETYSTTAYAREEESKKGMDGAQVTGSSSSYSRKYALSGLFGLDDTKDADATNTHGQEEKQPSMNLISWKQGIDACKTIEDLRDLYKQKESIITSNKEVMELFNIKKLTFTKTIN